MTPSLRSRMLILLLFLAPVRLGEAQVQNSSQNQGDLQSFLNSSNPHIRQYAYVLSASKWQSSHIFVCWENPSPQFQDDMSLVQQEVQETWASNSQLTFTGWQKCAARNKGIHILIDDSGPETKFLGRELDGLKNGMVLNFTFVAWGRQCQQMLQACIKGIAGHEFGHGIGFAHEQNRPDKPGECLEPPSGQNGDTLLTPYDPHSIMNYCNSVYNNNGKLSALDIDGVQELYGAPKQPREGASPQR